MLSKTQHLRLRRLWIPAAKQGLRWLDLSPISEVAQMLLLLLEQSCRAFPALARMD